MVKITLHADCGNSPKNLFLKQFNIAFAEGDTKIIEQSITDDITWEVVGVRRIQGKAAFLAEFDAMKGSQMVEYTLQKVFSHGSAGAANGEFKLRDGKVFGFCDIYEFSSAKGDQLKTIWSYMIEELGGLTSTTQ